MTRLGLASLMAFHVGQLAFGGVLWVWAPFMLVALGLLLRAERRAGDTPHAPPRRPMGTRMPSLARTADLPSSADARREGR